MCNFGQREKWSRQRIRTVLCYCSTKWTAMLRFHIARSFFLCSFVYSFSPGAEHLRSDHIEFEFLEKGEGRNSAIISELRVHVLPRISSFLPFRRMSKHGSDGVRQRSPAYFWLAAGKTRDMPACWQYMCCAYPLFVHCWHLPSRTGPCSEQNGSMPTSEGGAPNPGHCVGDVIMLCAMHTAHVRQRLPRCKKRGYCMTANHAPCLSSHVHPSSKT